MKAIVFGALLSQGLNAQVLGPAAVPRQGADIPLLQNIPVLNQFLAKPAPLLVPGPNAPSEADLLSSVANALSGGAGQSPSPPSTASLESPLPAGSSDVVLDSENDAPVNALGLPPYNPYGGVPPASSSAPYGGVPPAPSSAPYGGLPPASNAAPYGGVPPASSSAPYGGPPPASNAAPYGGLPPASNTAQYGGATTPGAGAGLLGGLLNNPAAIPAPVPLLNSVIGGVNSGVAGAIGGINSGGTNVASVVAGAVNGLASPVLGAVNNLASPIVSVGALVRTDFGAINLPTVRIPLIATPTPLPAPSPSPVPIPSPAPSSARPPLFGLPGAVAGVASNALGLVGGLVNPLFAAPTAYKPSTVSPVSPSTTSRPVYYDPYPTRNDPYATRNSFEIGLSYEISASGRFGLLAASEPTNSETTLTATDDLSLETGTATDDLSTQTGTGIDELLSATPAVLLALDSLPAAGGIDSLAAGFRPGVWDVDDNTIYDGQDYGDEDLYNGGDYKNGRKPIKGYTDDDDDVPCPSYCQKKYPDAGYKSKPTPPGYNAGGKYEPKQPAYPGYSRRSLRSRFEPASGGFAAFNWPNSKDDGEDAEDDDIPDWLYQSAGKKKPDTRPKCPASCYKPQKPYPPHKPQKPYPPYEPKDPYAAATPAPHYPPTYGSGRPNKPYGTWKPYRPQPSGGVSVSINSTTLEMPEATSNSTAPVETPEATGNSTAPVETPEGPPMSESMSESNMTPTMTATTLATVIVPYPSPPFSSVYAGDQSWTGETLASVCPKTCDPFHPDQNFCDITSSCSTAGGSKYYCACRAGYMASAWNAKDFSKQFHVPGQPYVYVAPGVVCDKVCSDQTCSQVLERPKCV